MLQENGYEKEETAVYDTDTAPVDEDELDGFELDNKADGWREAYLETVSKSYPK